jgi:hypothetical protein
MVVDDVENYFHLIRDFLVRLIGRIVETFSINVHIIIDEDERKNNNYHSQRTNETYHPKIEIDRFRKYLHSSYRFLIFLCKLSRFRR